jgi:GNAT superfamily N-acetyltransferase
MISIRKAITEDAHSIIDFQIKMALETESIDLDRKIVTKGVNAVLNDKNLGQYFVAESEDEVIASLLITNEWSDWRNCNVWWFQSVYVLPGFRRKGVFRKMYNFIKQLAEANDIAGLRLYVEKRNSSARKTYETLGMNSEHYSFYEWMRK